MTPVFAAGVTLALSADTAHHSSTYNTDVPDLARDDDDTTCAQTGYERGAWWAAELDNPLNVSAVEISGTGFMSIMINFNFWEIGSSGC